MLLVAVVAAEEVAVAVVLRLVAVVAGLGAGLMLRWEVLWESWPSIRTAC